MNDPQSLAHTRWEGKYHVVWIPTYRRKTLLGTIRRELGPVLRQLAQQKECEILEGQLMIDHLPRMISIPPQYAVWPIIGSLKGKSAIPSARTWGGRKQTFTGQHFWARGYSVSTVGIDEDIMRRYIQQPEAEDRRLDQLRWFD